MTINVDAMKRNSKEIIRTAKPSVIAIGMIYVAVIMLLGYLSSSLLSGNITESAARKYMNMIQNGNFEGALAYAETFKPSLPNSVINVVIRIVEWILSAGFLIFIMNTVRKTGTACVGNLLDGFGMFFRVFVLNLLITVFVALWTLLLVVPGIIAAYKYRQAMYILIDNPDKSPMQCIRESKQMMSGHKWELFGLDLSFIGWFLLELLFSPVGVWTKPYITTTRTLYYEALKAQNSYNYNYTAV